MERPRPAYGMPALIDEVGGADEVKRWFDSANGGLRPTPLFNDEQLVRLLERATFILDHQVASSTRSTYDRIQRFVANFHVQVLAADPTEPTPKTLFLLFAFLMSGGTASAQADFSQELPEGKPLATSYLVKIRNAIKSQWVRDHPNTASPTDHPMIRDLFRGYNRLHGRAPQRAKALSLRHLELIALGLQQPKMRAPGDHALCMLGCSSEIAITASELGRVDRWEQIEFPPANARIAPMKIHGARLDGKAIEVWPEKDTTICAVHALLAWRYQCSDREVIWPNPHGTPISRQAKVKQITRILDAHKCPRVRFDGLDRLGLSELATVGASLAKQAAIPIGRVQANALVTLGWWAMCRRGELVAFNWGDLTADRSGYLLYFAKSKMDQAGDGEFVHISAKPHSPACPIRALNAWRTRLVEALGRPVEASDPVFHVPYRIGQRLGAEAVNQTMQQLAREHGLGPGYRAHSLRAGLVTQALLQRNIGREQIARHGRWSNPHSIDTYARFADVADYDVTAMLDLD